MAAAGSKEDGRIESGFERLERSQDERALAAEVQTGVVAFRLQQPDVGKANDPAAVALADKYPL